MTAHRVAAALATGTAALVAGYLLLARSWDFAACFGSSCSGGDGSVPGTVAGWALVGSSPLVAGVIAGPPRRGFARGVVALAAAVLADLAAWQLLGDRPAVTATLTTATGALVALGAPSRSLVAARLVAVGVVVAAAFAAGDTRGWGAAIVALAAPAALLVVELAAARRRRA